MTPPVHQPRAMRSYACERSLVCCHHPVRAPVPADDQPRIAALLAQSEAGRLLAETLPDRVDEDWRDGQIHVWRQREGRCVNLDHAGRACELHRAAGLEVLPSSCRNYPRWVAALPDRVEAAYALTCPTAAGHLARATEPWRLEPVAPGAPWPWAPSRQADSEVAWTPEAQAPLAAALALRDAWWAELTRAGDDPAALVAVLAAMQGRPLSPGAADPAPADVLDTALGGGDAQTALIALERLPGRAPWYVEVRDAAFAELVQPLSERAFSSALEPIAADLGRFASHGLQWVGVHDPRPASVVVGLVARRTVLAARLVEALCARVPLALRVLVGDAFYAVSYVEP